MHAASLSSPRLVRVRQLLADGKPHSTREIVRKAKVMAVNACISELRSHGAQIHCDRRRVNGAVRFYYTMTKGPAENG